MNHPSAGVRYEDAPRALILAAGTGRRLQPETLDLPKCLVEVGGQSLLRGLLDGVVAAGVRDATLVIGHLADLVRTALASETPAGLCVSCVENPLFFRTNTLASVAMAAGDVRGHAFLLLNGDLWIQPEQLVRLLEGPDRFAMLIDGGVPDDEAMKVALDASGLVCAVGKSLPAALARGEAVGAYRFDADTGGRFLDDVCARYAQGDTTSFYEAAFERLFTEGARSEAIIVASRTAMEIDDCHDLARARLCAADVLARERGGAPAML
jgi:choline kinase